MFFSGDRYFHFFGDGLRQFALQGERIAHFAVIGLGPEMLVGCAANQLGRDANAIALFHDGAFDDGVHAQGSGDLRDGELGILETHHGGVRDDAQIVDVREAPDEGLGDAVGQVILRRIA